jgi:excisionase family DNA binding protein
MGELLNVAELARYLKFHQTTIYRLLKSGGIPGIRLGGSWRFHREAIDRWLKDSERADRTQGLSPVKAPA